MKAELLDITHEPLLFCFCGPSGSGKSTICGQLVNMVSALALSVSTTTRTPRPSEIEGIHYFFVSREEFTARIGCGDFLEHAEYSGNRYGTEKRSVAQALESGKDLVLDIDVQGVRQLKELYGSRCIAIFVHPPSHAELVRRITSRGTENADVLERRLQVAQLEIAELKNPRFSDYLLIIDRLEVALQRALSIVVVERMRLRHQREGYISKVLT